MFHSSIETIQLGIEALNQFNSTPSQGTTRILFTQEELQARAYIKEKMCRIGLIVEEDAIGNIFGSLEGTNKELPPIWSGSHIDTVYNAGMFDGMAGVIGAIEALRVIKQSGVRHKRTIKALVFTSEEPTRFGLCCLGSRAMANHLSSADTYKLMDCDGNSLADTLLKLGYELKDFPHIIQPKGAVYANIELHIEQGAVLEKKGIPIGIVETICAPTNLEVVIKGQQEHAGSTPMNIRCDALVASSEIIIAIEDYAKDTSSPNTVATVGKLNVFPNAANVIPGEVSFSIDIRDSMMETKEVILEKIVSLFDYISNKRKVKITHTVTNHDVPRPCSDNINAIIRDICNKKNINFHNMVSGAYHDAIFVAEFAPTSMIFVPSKGGLSHHPDEWTNYEDIQLGVDLLAEVLFTLSNE